MRCVSSWAAMRCRFAAFCIRRCSRTRSLLYVAGLAGQSHDALAPPARAGKLTLERTLQSAQERIARFVGAGAAAPVPRIVQIPLGVDVPPPGASTGTRPGVCCKCLRTVIRSSISGASRKATRPIWILCCRPWATGGGGPEVHFILAGHSMDQSYSMHLADPPALAWHCGSNPHHGWLSGFSEIHHHGRLRCVRGAERFRAGDLRAGGSGSHGHGRPVIASRLERVSRPGVAWGTGTC